MKRRYRSRHYEDRLRKARALMPDAALGADVMVGFPGESEEEFMATHDFIERLPFTYLHVFTYSERPGTPAVISRGSVPTAERKRRNRVLRELGARKNLEFRRQFLGKSLSVVTLEEGFPALSSNYLKVDLAATRPANRLLEVAIGAVTESGLRERGLFPMLGSRE
jgi:threonylcarbamoyladenosine tRNA methylthiotransferase MtaB